jgi:chorismate dehydratase
LEKSIRLAIVSYLNTLPFLKGFEMTKDHPFEVILAKPSDCAKLFTEGSVDIALAPVGILPFIENYNLITSYCIGCEGEVRTVVLMSNDELSNVKNVYLDSDSRTSVLLCKVLYQQLWKRKVNFIDGLPEKFENIKKGEAILAIGDKVFQNEGKLKNIIDLGKEWQRLTYGPFAFAVFLAKPDLPDGISTQLNEILKKGIDYIPNLDLSSYKHIPRIEEYYSKHISYNFDKQKWISMKNFIEYVNYLDREIEN